MPDIHNQVTGQCLVPVRVTPYQMTRFSPRARVCSVSFLCLQVFPALKLGKGVGNSFKQKKTEIEMGYMQERYQKENWAFLKERCLYNLIQHFKTIRNRCLDSILCTQMFAITVHSDSIEQRVSFSYYRNSPWDDEASLPMVKPCPTVVYNNAFILRVDLDHNRRSLVVRI